ncbi:putative N-acetyltransferase 16 [Petromyzon marinus]|uniref:putative N-acetyltransferase 16 n=1 Tax=Petromyzon marinus TaxID=7757 RepID=UPI003F71E689
MCNLCFVSPARPAVYEAQLALSFIAQSPHTGRCGSRVGAQSSAHKGMEQDLVFNLARPEDYEEVMRMSEGIYEGKDYLPSIYHDWLKDPNRTVMLAQLQGRIVALESLLLTDGGATALVGGLRVGPEHRGRGVAGLIQRHTLEYVRERHSGVMRKHVLRGDTVGPEVLKSHRLLFTRVMFHLHVTSEAMAATVARAADLTDRSLSLEVRQSEAEAILLSAAVVDDLLPARLFVHNWEPCRPDPVNFPALRRLALTWATDDPREPSVLSVCGRAFPIPKPSRWWRQDVDVFSSSSKSSCCLAAVNAQVAFHLARAPEAAPGGNVLLYVSVESTLAEGVHGFLAKVLGSAALIDRFEQKLLEVDL